MVQRKVLIISADEDRARLIRAYLSGAGYKVEISRSGENAFVTLLTAIPSLVLLDWRLPDLSSLAVLRRLRAAEKTAMLPLILMGSGMSDEDRLVGLETGADLCLEEPFHPKEFLARVHALMRRVYRNGEGE
jgi:two-component system phosphate regulon response regulator PhoB